jgi:branched-chain amino acid aminotransferase
MIWMNGERQRGDGPHVSASDRGLTLADGAFETMPVIDGTVFRLDRHLARLARALTTLAIAEPASMRDWIVTATQSAAGAMSLRVTVTRGVAGGGLAPSGAGAPTVVIALAPMPQFPAATYDPGLSVHVASGRRNEHAVTAGLKTLAYTDAVAAMIEANRAGFDEALFLDTSGHCSEASASNLFAWTGRELLTPPTACGALPGITRGAVLEIAAGAGIPAVERAFTMDVLLECDEAFLTSSLRGIAPIARVAHASIGRGAPGPVTDLISTAYRRLVNDECRS